MFRRKNAVVAFLLVAVMLLSVGFAALSDELEVYGGMRTNSSAFQDAFDAAIYIDSAEFDLGAGSVDGEIYRDPNGDADTIEFLAEGFTTVGDIAYVNVVVKNDHPTLDAVLNATVSELDGAETDCFEVVCTLPENATLTPEGFNEFAVYVKLVDIPTKGDDCMTGFTLTINAESK